MELTYLLMTGSLSGLVSILGNSVFWSAAELIRPPTRATYADLPAFEVLLHMGCGIGLGFLFWLSWGLAAIVDVPWWQRGLTFGGLCIVVLVLPLALSLTMGPVAGRRMDKGLIAALTSRWITTCLVTGLACAWGWARRM